VGGETARCNGKSWLRWAGEMCICECEYICVRVREREYVCKRESMCVHVHVQVRECMYSVDQTDKCSHAGKKASLETLCCEDEEKLLRTADDANPTTAYHPAVGGHGWRTSALWAGYQAVAAACCRAARRGPCSGTADLSSCVGRAVLGGVGSLAPCPPIGRNKMLARDKCRLYIYIYIYIYISMYACMYVCTYACMF